MDVCEHSGCGTTNHAVERAVRPAMMWRKGCCGTRSENGSRFVERMVTVGTTCTQQQHELFFLALWEAF